jgi:membrane protease YdiL (CAAX protease family)
MLNFLKKEWLYILIAGLVCFSLILILFSDKPVNKKNSASSFVKTNSYKLQQNFKDVKFLENLIKTRPLLFINILLLILINMGLIFGGGILLIVYLIIRISYKDILPQSFRVQTKVPWNIWDIVKTILFYIFPMLLLSRILYLTGLFSFINKWVSKINIVLFNFLIGYLLLIIFIFYVLRQYGYTFRLLGLEYKKNKRKNLFYGLAIYAGFYPLFLLISYLNKIFYKISPSQEGVFRIIALTDRSFLSLCFLIIIICIVAPIIEEIFFRGFILMGLKRYIRTEYAVVFSGIIFAVFHFDISVFLPIGVLGLLLGYLREKTSSLTLPIVIHAIHNSVVTFQAITIFKLISVTK